MSSIEATSSNPLHRNHEMKHENDVEDPPDFSFLYGNTASPPEDSIKVDAALNNAQQDHTQNGVMPESNLLDTGETVGEKEKTKKKQETRATKSSPLRSVAEISKELIATRPIDSAERRLSDDNAHIEAEDPSHDCLAESSSGVDAVESSTWNDVADTNPFALDSPSSDILQEKRPDENASPALSVDCSAVKSTTSKNSLNPFSDDEGDEGEPEELELEKRTVPHSTDSSSTSSPTSTSISPEAEKQSGWQRSRLPPPDKPPKPQRTLSEEQLCAKVSADHPQSAWQAARLPRDEYHRPFGGNPVSTDSKDMLHRRSSESSLATDSSTDNKSSAPTTPTKKKALPLHFPTSQTAERREALTPELRQMLRMGYIFQAIKEVSLTCGGHADAMQRALLHEVRTKENVTSIWRTPWIIRVVSWLPNHTDFSSHEDTFTGYIINVSLTRSNLTWRVIRRFSKFVTLERDLSRYVPSQDWIAQSSLFPHETFFGWLSGSHTTDKMRNDRQAALDRWFQELCASPRILGIPRVYEAMSDFLEAEPKMMTLTDKQLLSSDEGGTSAWRGEAIDSRIPRRRASNLT